MSTVDDRASAFEHGGWTAGVVGLGYVGLPLAMAASRRGLKVIGFDVSVDTVRRLASGESTVGDVTDADLATALGQGFQPTTDESALSASDAVFICVPSPLDRSRHPDLSSIQAAADSISRIARPGMLIALESTSYPGTTDEILVPAITRAGLEVDRDVFVCFSPERVSPGSGIDITTIPKVVGGVTPASGQVGAAAYGRVFDRVHLVGSARVAEMSKLLENTFRAVNIALINELTQLADEIDIDIWEVIAAAATKPFGFSPFYPGPGVGGHCIPLDPQYLAWSAKRAEFDTRFIDLAEQVNSGMPGYTADRVARVLAERGVPLQGARILAVGVAYKPNVSDARESPALDVIAELTRRGAVVTVWDPMIPVRQVEALGVTPAEGPSPGTAVAVVLTDHDAMDLAELARSVPVVFDARGAYARRGIQAANVVAL